MLLVVTRLRSRENRCLLESFLNQFIPGRFNYLRPLPHSCADSRLRYAKFFGQGNLARSKIHVCPIAHQAACRNGTFAFTASEHLGGLKPHQGSHAVYDSFKIVSPYKKFSRSVSSSYTNRRSIPLAIMWCKHPGASIRAFRGI